MPELNNSDEINISNKYGLFIKNKRKERNWSIRFAAGQLNVSATYWNDLEMANRPAPPKDKLMIIAKMFDIDTDKKALYEYLDMAAETRNTIPIDVEEFITENPIFIEFIRKAKDRDILTTSYIESLLKNIKIE